MREARRPSPLKSAFSPGGDEIRYLGAGPESRVLLTRACEKLFPPNFDDGDVIEARTLPDLLCDNDDPANNGTNEAVFSVIGKNLGRPDEVIKGLCAGYYFPASQTGALWYLVVDGRFRREGLGAHLVADMQDALKQVAQRQGRELTGTFAHIEDPDDDSHGQPKFDPAARVRFYARLGTRKAAVNFTSPATDYSEEVPYMLVCVPDRDGRLPGKDDILGHITDYYQVYGVEEPARHPAFQRMVGELEQAEKDGRLLAPLAQDRAPVLKAPAPSI